MTRYRIIVNPISGRGAGERAIPRIKHLLDGYGIDYDMVRTNAPWHAAELAHQSVETNYDVVVGVGGDGTANELINGLLLAKYAGKGSSIMGLIGVGRGNDFAYGVGIPNGVEEGCRVLAQGYRRLIDIGRVTGGDYPEGRYFGNGVGIGFDAVVGFEALKMTHLHGFISYIVAAIKTIFLYYKAPLIHLNYNETEITQPMLMVSIMNGRRMGGVFMMAPSASTEDGLLDLCIAQQVSRPRIFPLILHFLRGTQDTQKPIKTGRSGHIVATAIEGSLPAHADGETLCTQGQQLTIEILPKQLEILHQPRETRS